MKIYTKTGDLGETSLVGGFRVDKSSDRIETYGLVDELNSNVGLLRSLCADSSVSELLLTVQHHLFVVGGNLATDTDLCPIRQGNFVTEEMIDFLEHKIDEFLTELPPTKLFVVPGGVTAAASSHVCRTVCRRAEREIVRLDRSGGMVDANVIKYINRLSDFFFVLARYLNFKAGVEENIWKRL